MEMEILTGLTGQRKKIFFFFNYQIVTSDSKHSPTDDQGKNED